MLLVICTHYPVRDELIDNQPNYKPEIKLL